MDAGQVLINAEVTVEEVLTLIEELNGFGLVYKDSDVLANRLAALGLARAEEPEDALLDEIREITGLDLLSVLTALENGGLEPRLFHSGGGIWLVEIPLTDINVPDPGDPNLRTHPFIWISPNEDTTWPHPWVVYPYLHWEDDGVLVAPVYFETESAVEAVKELEGRFRRFLSDNPQLLTYDTFEDFFEANANDVVHGHIDIPAYWGFEMEFMLTTGHHGIAYLPLHRDDGVLSYYWPEILRFTRRDVPGEVLFALRWHDGVTGEWVEWFPSYDGALARFAWLLLVAVKDLTFDELDIEVRKPPTPEPSGPTILEHWDAKHPGQNPEVLVWWDIPYKHYGSVENGVLEINGNGSSGEGLGDNTYFCAECGDELALGDLEEDYT